MSSSPLPITLAPSCKSCFSLSGLQSPFAWQSRVLDAEDCHVVEDKLCLLGTPWAVLLNRLHTAYSHFCRRNFRKGRARLVQCYMPLLPFDFFHASCGIVHSHREALRHVLDATWAAMEQLGEMRRTGGEHLHQTDVLWRAYTDSITPYRKLSKAQRAAVCAIRGTLDNDPDALREAMALNPGEGEWQYKLGYMLEEERGPPPGRRPPKREELDALRRAFRLRKNADTYTRLARSLAGTGPEGVAEAVRLFDEAMRLYPDHPRVLFQAGCFLPELRKQLPGYVAPAEGDPSCATDDEDESSMRLFQRCLDAVQGRCAYVLCKLATCKIAASARAGRDAGSADGGRDAASDESIAYFDRALAINRDAVNGFQKEIVLFAAAAKAEREANEARAARKADKEKKKEKKKDGK